VVLYQPVVFPVCNSFASMSSYSVDCMFPLTAIIWSFPAPVPVYPVIVVPDGSLFIVAIP